MNATGMSHHGSRKPWMWRPIAIPSTSAIPVTSSRPAVPAMAQPARDWRGAGAFGAAIPVGGRSVNSPVRSLPVFEASALAVRSSISSVVSRPAW